MNRLYRAGPIVVGFGCVLGWLAYERAVAGSDYRWTTWQELESLRRATKPKYPASLHESILTDRLDGQRVFFVGELSSPPDDSTAVLRMPARSGQPEGGVAVAILHGYDGAAFGPAGRGLARRGVVRCWGRLSLVPTPDRLPRDGVLQVQVDRVQRGPPYLLDTLAPRVPFAWFGWFVGATTATVALVGIVRGCVRFLRHHRWAAATVTFVSTSAAAMVVVVVWVVEPRPFWVTVACRGRLVEGFVGPTGAEIRSADNYPRDVGDIAFSRDTVWEDEKLHRFAGLRGRSFYTGEEDGDVHACFVAGVSAGFVGVAATAVAILSARLAVLNRGRLGYCRRCGYDLRASPIRCPECGSAVVRGLVNS